jgi:hypothetical protein
MVLVGLGTVWILDGLEVAIVGTISSRRPRRIGFRTRDSQVGRANDAEALVDDIGRGQGLGGPRRAQGAEEAGPRR